MRQDGRLARMVHVLIHMGLLGGRETSDIIARMLKTNPVVVRRTMSALKLSGIVHSEGGRGGGWKLERPLTDLTVLDVQLALDEGPLIAPGIAQDHPTCPVESATNAALRTAFAIADGALRDELSRLTLAELAHTAVEKSQRGEKKDKPSAAKGKRRGRRVSLKRAQ